MQESKSWSTITRYFVLVLILGGLLWLVISARDLIGPLAISALLAYVINPIAVWVDLHSRLNRQWVVLLVYLVVLAAFIIAGVLIAPIIPAQIASLAEQLETITVLVQSVIDTPVTILNVAIPLDMILANWPAVTQDFTRPDLIINALAATSQNLVWVLVVVVTTYYLLLDWSRLREWFLGLVPDDYEGDAYRLYHEIRRVWNQYSRGQLRLMLVIGLLTGVASAAIGLPGAFAFAVLAGILDIILTVGTANRNRYCRHRCFCCRINLAAHLQLLVYDSSHCHIFRDPIVRERLAATTHNGRPTTPAPRRRLRCCRQRVGYGRHPHRSDHRSPAWVGYRTRPLSLLQNLRHRSLARG